MQNLFKLNTTLHPRSLAFVNRRLMSSIVYSTIEEPEFKVDESKIGADNQLFQIVHKNNTLVDLCKYYRSQKSLSMPLLHKSMILSKVCNLARRRSSAEAQSPAEEQSLRNDLQQAREVAEQSAKLLFDSVEELDRASLV